MGLRISHNYSSGVSPRGFAGFDDSQWAGVSVRLLPNAASKARIAQRVIMPLVQMSRDLDVPILTATNHWDLHTTVESVKSEHMTDSDLQRIQKLLAPLPNIAPVSVTFDSLWVDHAITLATHNVPACIEQIKQDIRTIISGDPNLSLYYNGKGNEGLVHIALARYAPTTNLSSEVLQAIVAWAQELQRSLDKDPIHITYDTMTITPNIDFYNTHEVGLKHIAQNATI